MDLLHKNKSIWEDNVASNAKLNTMSIFLILFIFPSVTREFTQLYFSGQSYPLFCLLNNSNLLMGYFLQWLNIYLIYAVFDVSLIQRQGDTVFLYVDGYGIARK
ncbi:hypothetical protein [Salmonella enterica]|uniref:Uncharacterized protein n=2 Tax=Salmonella enterica TaxID=28901 RepID=A0A379QLP7_SALER|nr:hypothetical protein [Salmonella enterica]ECC1482416.1 hypothetical protein [Salmonella enterica subsp. salamae]EHM1748906.1 hypothetical protein [Salmonella enterica subsp. salamae serovar 40:c:e,n,x,z15]HCM1997449.1 hypothetical protein [Salmonella enterica subsp. salamae serovar [1],40:z35:e,n,x,z15]ASG87866.1 hypothetical protein LFZ47_09810 [Salmonella enterica subsp. salamae serovar 55:k:z39 str. 1315K]ECC1656746.1 hypothetical protein [Salmonella enterica subsp. salamae]